jgi:hypothetical protein
MPLLCTWVQAFGTNHMSIENRLEFMRQVAECAKAEEDGEDVDSDADSDAASDDEIINMFYRSQADATLHGRPVDPASPAGPEFVQVEVVAQPPPTSLPNPHLQEMSPPSPHVSHGPQGLAPGSLGTIGSQGPQGLASSQFSLPPVMQLPLMQSGGISVADPTSKRPQNVASAAAPLPVGFGANNPRGKQARSHPVRYWMICSA